jgi:hypothetical protein
MPIPPCARFTERFDLRERLEDSPELFGGNADAGVPDPNHGFRANLL